MKRIENKLVEVVRNKEATVKRGENNSLKAVMVISKGRKKKVTVAPKEEKVQVVKDTVNVTVNVTVKEYAVLDDSMCELIKANKVKRRQAEIADEIAKNEAKRQRQKALSDARKQQDRISLLMSLLFR